MFVFCLCIALFLEASSAFGGFLAVGNFIGPIGPAGSAAAAVALTWCVRREYRLIRLGARIRSWPMLRLVFMLLVICAVAMGAAFRVWEQLRVSASRSELFRVAHEIKRESDALNRSVTWRNRLVGLYPVVSIHARPELDHVLFTVGGDIFQRYGFILDAHGDSGTIRRFSSENH